MKDYVMVKEMNAYIISNLLIYNEEYFVCKSGDTVLWCYHKNDIPSKYKELVESVKWQKEG